MIPASIRECVDRAKLGMVGREDESLSEGDLLVAAKSMKYHMELLNPKPAQPSNSELLATSLRKAVNGHDEVIGHIHKKVIEIRDRV